MSVQTMRPTLLNRRGKLTFKHLRISSSPPILLLFIMFETPGLFLSFLLFSPDRFQFTAFSRHAALLLPTTRGGRNLTARNLRGLIHILFFFFHFTKLDPPTGDRDREHYSLRHGHTAGTSEFHQLLLFLYLDHPLINAPSSYDFGWTRV